MQQGLYPQFPVHLKDTVRFLIERLDGGRSGTWRPWRSGAGDDLYLAARSLAGLIKVSLHGSGHWRWGFTDQFALEAERQGFIDVGGDRAKGKWEPLSLWMEVPHATCVHFPGRDAQTAGHRHTDKRPTIVLVAPPDDHIVSVHVWIAEPNADLGRPGKKPEHAIIASIPLPSGRRAVMTAEQTVITFDQSRTVDEASCAQRPSFRMGRGTASSVTRASVSARVATPTARHRSLTSMRRGFNRSGDTCVESVARAASTTSHAIANAPSRPQATPPRMHARPCRTRVVARDDRRRSARG